MNSIALKGMPCAAVLAVPLTASAEVEVRTCDHTDVSIAAHRARFGLNAPVPSGS
jgi:hypothetical protein